MPAKEMERVRPQEEGKGMSKIQDALGDKAVVVRIRRPNQTTPTKIYETPAAQAAVEDEWDYEDEWWGS